MTALGALGELALGEGGSSADIRPSSIDTAEAFGTATLSSDGYILTGIGEVATGEAFDLPGVVTDGVPVWGAGAIASAEAFGSPTLTQIMYVYPSSIDSGEAFGTPFYVLLNATYLPVSRIM